MDISRHLCAGIRDAENGEHPPGSETVGWAITGFFACLGTEVDHPIDINVHSRGENLS